MPCGCSLHHPFMWPLFPLGVLWPSFWIFIVVVKRQWPWSMDETWSASDRWAKSLQIFTGVWTRTSPLRWDTTVDSWCPSGHRPLPLHQWWGCKRTKLCQWKESCVRIDEIPGETMQSDWIEFLPKINRLHQCEGFPEESQDRGSHCIPKVSFTVNWQLKLFHRPLISVVKESAIGLWFHRMLSSQTTEKTRTSLFDTYLTMAFFSNVFV